MTNIGRAWKFGLGVFLACGLVVTAFAAPTSTQNGMAATVHPLATDAAVQAMRDGGNAVDAAVAAALTLGVVDGQNSGIGGGCFMLIGRPDGTFVALDGRETAPAAATRDMFLREGKAEPDLSQTGALAIGIPGSLAVYDHAIRKFGKRSLKSYLLSAARIAEQGFAVNQDFAGRLKDSLEAMDKFPASREVFLKADGTAYRAGDVIVQADLAKSYRGLAESGVDWFYRQPFPELAATWMEKNGGLVTARDFHEYRFKQREPVRSTYRGCEIVGFPPPSSGGVHVAQILNILESFDLKAMGAGSVDFVHVVAEAMKLAFADRAHWLGDPDFAPVPRGLVSKAYAAELAKRIRMERVIEVASQGEPPGATTDLFGKHTTHFSTADAEGNWVACTATVNLSFGSKVVIPGTGIVMNDQMDDFSAQPGVPNAFGLVGSEANAVAPGKRPLSSMSPTLVLREGRPVLAVGAAGGPTIISQTVLAIVGVIDFGMAVEEALAQPRFHQQWKPDTLRVEKRMSEPVQRGLEARGHV
ncbi:MAG TPA: gamma-glutamyltransferase, partial [Verrucomicrobiae bacterium]|nr:gamma-glutamyltransferase [Verrucomicrobiae bacterium]